MTLQENLRRRLDAAKATVGKRAMCFCAAGCEASSYYDISAKLLVPYPNVEVAPQGSSVTDLNKPVRRRGMTRYRGRRIVVSLEPGDMLGFRLERTRRTEYLTIAGCYERAVMIRVNHERAEKRKAKGKS